MEYNFKKFEGRNVRLEDRITVTKSYAIGFPTKFYIDNGVREFQYVVLFWDAENKAIGIRFTNDEVEKNKFRIIHSKNGYGGSIVVRSFFRSHGIDPVRYHGRYAWEKYPLEGVGDIFVLRLQEKSG
ncbi:MAG: hypothetical protein Q8R13_01500 [bacterium]|nr:hypothetical protein [bacterium]